MGDPDRTGQYADARMEHARIWFGLKTGYLRTAIGFSQWLRDVTGWRTYMDNRKRLHELATKIRNDWAARQPRGRAAYK
jgi:hypothetical protein